MKNVVGIFRESGSARRAADNLRKSGIPSDRVNLLTPADPEGSAEQRIPTSETEQPGMGGALGGVVGGAAGASAGMGLGAAAASLLIPGIGPVAAVGLAAAALFGAGGAVGGAIAGNALENSMSHGLPKDELYLYEDALRKGHSVVFVLADDETQADSARAVLEAAGAESLDDARESWWVGIRDAEASVYEEKGGHFETDEPHYRKGFEAALHPERRGRSYEEASSDLSRAHPEHYSHPAFRHGYERGAEHARGLSQSFEDADTGEYAVRSPEHR